LFIWQFLVCKTNVNWMSTFTGRLGFVADKALIHLKGGDVSERSGGRCLNLLISVLISSSRNLYLSGSTSKPDRNQ
jgi:hypothetical protein